MLVFISDIHLTDGTAFPSYLPARAFGEVFFDHLVSILRRRSGVKELNLVLLGDFFDLIRTKDWWTIGKGRWKPKKVTPWSEDQKGIGEETLKILQRIVKRNKAILQAIKDLPERLLSQEFPRLEVIEITYVPGNHDRLITLPLVWKEAKESLGEVRLFNEGFFNPKGYRVLAFHGHQLDCLNRKDKGIPPIGDFISSLVTAIPYWIEAEMKREGFPPDLIESFKKRMLRIDDVRPQSAVLSWLLSVAKGEKEDLRDFLQRFIFRALEEVVEDPFVKKWIKAHDEELGMYDELFEVVTSINAVKFLGSLGEKFMTLDMLAKLANKFRGEKARDTYAEKLLRACNKEFSKEKAPFEWEVQKRIKGVDFIIIGHTHEAKNLPLNGGVYYLNTGTWRRYVTQTMSEETFVTSQRLTFVIVYKEDEAEDRRFEQWNGVMIKGA